jgi:hypothetical protein
MLKDSEQVRLIALLFANILVWASFLSIIFFTNPAGAGILGITILYVSFGIGMGSFGLIIWQLINRKKN